MSKFTPSDLTNETPTISLDLEKAKDKFAKDSKKFITVAPYKVDEKSFKLVLHGEVSTNGIATYDWEQGKKKVTTYSIGIRFDNEDDVTAFDFLNEILSNCIGSDYDVLQVIKDEILYLKLKLANDKKSFKGVRSNVKLDPKRTDDINMGQKVSVYCELGCYINFDNSKAGITIKPIQFDFEEDEVIEVKSKKAKHN
jgi:hypothetical protein